MCICLASYLSGLIFLWVCISLVVCACTCIFLCIRISLGSYPSDFDPLFFIPLDLYFSRFVILFICIFLHLCLYGFAFLWVFISLVLCTSACVFLWTCISSARRDNGAKHA